MSFRAHLSVAGFGLAGVYAVVGVVSVIAVGDLRTGLIFAVSALVTAGLIAILLPLLAPRGGDDSGPDDGGGGPGGGDGPPPPPWWPEFEREFWSHVGDGGSGKRGSGRERSRA